MRRGLKKRKRAAAWMTAMLLTSSYVCSVTVFGAPEAGEVTRIWDFEDGTQGWVYDDSWSGDSYKGEGSCTYDEEKRMLKLNLDYSLNIDNSYSQTGICLSEEEGIDYSPYKALSFDLYYDPSAFTTGKLIAKAFSNNIFGDQSCIIHETPSEEVDGLRLVNVTLSCDEKYTQREKPGKLMLLLIGEYTDYHGDIWIDNIILSNVKKEKFLKETTIPVKTETILSAGDGVLSVNGSSFVLEPELKLADPNADACVSALYQYLKAVGESDSTLYGHMEDTVLKAGSSQLSDSDTEDVTGSLAAIVGMDCGGLFGGFASKYNERHPGAGIPDTNEGNIKAAAMFSNESIQRGAMITLSSHMPNFSQTVKLEGNFSNSYDGFDFSPADSYVLTGDCMNQILPGGTFHEAYCAHLDVIADYVRQVEGPVLFRPLHENTGSWFWWGKAFCDAETYKSVYKFTVEYLRDEKEIHNLLYLYGPGSEAANLEEYEERYPGDEYVDLVGFDTYDNNPVPDSEGYTFLTSFENTLKLTDAFAKKHGKLMAVTETGMSSVKSGGIPETGNRRPEWYMEMLDIMTKPEYDCCYFMLWSNYARSGGYYSPFVMEKRAGGKLYGHELLDSFVAMYNSKKSIFAQDQAEVMKRIVAGSLGEVKLLPYGSVSGYITEPVAGERILGERTLSARFNQEMLHGEFRLESSTGQVSLTAETNGNKVETVLDGETLAKLGEDAGGKIGLYVNGEKLQEIRVIYNIAPRPEDPLQIDDFESYAGLLNLLLDSWSSNKDSGCELNISLSDEFKNQGEYALKFEYMETQNGWAGCEFPKEADWSDCDALQIWVKPDGNNQKTVVQINTANGGSYEAYLQDYPEYASTTDPLLITLPFGEFQDKNGKGSLSSEAASNISGFGLWVNAIGGSPAMDEKGEVRGALYYDDIKAVSSGKTMPEFVVTSQDGGAEEVLDVKTTENKTRESSTTTEHISWVRYLIPFLSGGVTLAAAIAALLLALDRRRK